MKPEQVKIIIERNDGGVTVMSFVTKGLLNAEGDVFERDPTAKNINAEILKARLDCKRWRFLAEGEELPTDRTFRDAWKDDGGISVDMPKAREIHKDALRKQRKPLLDALDVEFMRAVEVDDKAKQENISSRKQVLRDVTDKPEIEAAQTPEELKMVGI